MPEVLKLSIQQTLRERFPLPELPEDGYPFHFELDGGGRSLIENLIHLKGGVLLEIGCFLNGSVLRWLKSDLNIRVVGIDLWPDDDSFIRNIERYEKTLPQLFGGNYEVSKIKSSLLRYGPYIQSCINIKGYLDRFFPVRAESPGVLNYLYEIGLKPSIIYIDASKTRADIDICHLLWPDAVICGDDWTWPRGGVFPMQDAVIGFCEEHGYIHQVERATWVIKKR